ncbi:c-type cytochrome [Mongoliimonas terrestris]|uniref:c-type cytochrome n=1 Tax=Mongoliimonas terrestris TaxID=1709001 RepID=UPI0009FAFA68|nr:cytochrome c [Mongoliimonas terrestris]
MRRYGPALRRTTLAVGLLLATGPLVLGALAQEAVPPEAPPDAGTSPVAPEAVVPEGSVAPLPEPSARTGRAYLEQVCSGCHAVGATGDSPNGLAPPFRDMLKDYSAEDLEESLAEGIVTGHPDMPEVVLDPPQIANVVAYLDALAIVTGN